jgi:GTP pyrophosphokinase
MKRREREAYINEVIDIFKEKLESVNIKSEITGRAKNFYSIYKKMVKQEKELSEIYDLIAVRVIVESIKDCYGALGIIHTMWKPIPGRFKDYIAMPKANMYQSLHTTVVGPRGEPFEVQIRTSEMHRIAEYGIAAHWRYKEGSTVEKPFDEKLSWLRRLLDWQQDMKDAGEFMESLRTDLFSDMVYVFTPKGDVVELPSGSTPLDFAYRVHTDVGHRCVGSKINGKITTIDYKLNNGDIVDILTLKGHGPSRDWLKIVKTSQAKNRIRSWFKKEFRDENIIKGRDALEKEARKQGLEIAEALKQDRLQEFVKKYKVALLEDLYNAIGDSSISAFQIVQKIKDDIKKDKVEELPPELKPWTGFGKPSQGIRVKGIDNCVVRMSRCCNPLPGDPILGYVTRGRGVSVHRVDCSNVCNSLQNEGERLIDVAWDTHSDAIYQVELEATAIDRPRLAMEIMSTISDTKTVINSFHARATKNKLATVTLKIEIRNLDHLEYIMEKVRRIKDVVEVRRIIPN